MLQLQLKVKTGRGTLVEGGVLAAFGKANSVESVLKVMNNFKE